MNEDEAELIQMPAEIARAEADREVEVAATVGKYATGVNGPIPDHDPVTSADGYWQREAQRARAERDALALRLLQMADAWVERFTDTGIRVDVAADAIRAAVENMGGR